MSAQTLEGQLAAQSDRFLTLLENRNTLFAGPHRTGASDRRRDRQHRQPDRRTRGRSARRIGALRQPFRVRLLHVLRRHPALRPVARQREQLVHRGGADGIQGRPSCRSRARSSCSGRASTVSAPRATSPTWRRSDQPRASRAGSFKLSEMNFAGWNRVDYRVISNTSAATSRASSTGSSRLERLPEAAPGPPVALRSRRTQAPRHVPGEPGPSDRPGREWSRRRLRHRTPAVPAQAATRSRPPSTSPVPPVARATT